MENIKIEGFKSIKELSLDLNRVNILIGANGSGKSNFITFFEFLNVLYKGGLQEYIALNGGADKLLHKGAKITQKINFEVTFNGNVNGYEVSLGLSENRFLFLKEYLVYKGGRGWSISNFGTEAAILRTDNYRAKYVLNYLRGLRKYHFHDTSKNSPFSGMSNIKTDGYFLYERGDNLAAYLWKMRESCPAAYRRVLSTIQSMAPYFSDFLLEPNSEGFVQLHWQSKYSSTVYGANDFSDGTLRFIALVTLFLQTHLPSCIIIDEPELGLHPFAIAKLAGMIKSAAALGNQVVVATQSAELISYFDPDDIITVDQIDGESRFQRLDNDQLRGWLETYSLGELWQRNIISSGQPQ